MMPGYSKTRRVVVLAMAVAAAVGLGVTAQEPAAAVTLAIPR